MRKNTGHLISAEAIKGKEKDKTINGFNQSLLGKGWNTEQGLDYLACRISMLLRAIAARSLEVIFCQNISWDILAARSQRILYQDLLILK